MDAATLREAMGATLTAARYAELLPAFDRFLTAADCTTPRRAAMAIAQTGHESLGLRYGRELWGPTAQQAKYDPASGSSLSRTLGNTQPGDGRRFAGAGWLQVTGRANFTAVSAWAHARGYVPTATYFVDHPDELASDRYVWIGPAWYWTAARSGLNARADAGDVEGATRLVNGGTYGLADRRERYDHALALGNAILPAGASAPAVAPTSGGSATLRLGSSGEPVAELQRVLNAWYKRAAPDWYPLTLDGEFGPATERAVRYYQQAARLTVDGIAGPRTLAGLGLA